MSQVDIVKRMLEYAVVPVIAIEDVEKAIPLADALIAGGIPVAEITFRTEAAAEAIQRMRTERPDMIVGAGTVLTLDNLEAAQSSGAQFAVAPGYNPAILKRAKALALPFLPGVATPSEVEAALEQGCTVQKFFPAAVMGGTSMLKAFAGPYGHTGIRFVPLGGVNPENMSEYLALPVVGAVGGTWLATKEDIAESRWELVAERCQQALEIVKAIRG